MGLGVFVNGGVSVWVGLGVIVGVLVNTGVRVAVLVGIVVGEGVSEGRTANVGTSTTACGDVVQAVKTKNSNEAT